MKQILFSSKPIQLDIAALLARLIFGGFMIMGHGWFKVKLWLDGRAITFAVTMGLGAEIELAMAIFAEIFCALLVVVGFQTRLAAIPLIYTMFVAALVYHYKDNFFYLPHYSSNKEFALIYAAGFILIFFLGAGKYSIDYLLNKNKNE